MDYKEKYEELVEAARAVVEGNPGLCDMNKRLGRVRDLLPEKESEDERIRKDIITTLSIGVACDESALHPGACTTLKEALAYLEKQKEQKYYTYEQSKQAAEDCYYDKGYNTEDGGRCNEQSFLWGFEEGVNWCEKQKEQKPARTNNIDLDTKVNVWVGYTLNDNTQSYSRKDVQIMLDNCARYFYDYAVMCLDKPAEWSEYDEQWLESIIKDYEDSLVKDKDHAAVIKIKIDFLKSLRHQPHWKPSEEQMEALKLIVSNKKHYAPVLHEIALDTLYNDLKSL